VVAIVDEHGHTNIQTYTHSSDRIFVICRALQSTDKYCQNRRERLKLAKMFP